MMSDVSFTRRDMIEVQAVTGIPAGALFKVHDGERVPTAEFMLGAQYVAEKKGGLTELDWEAWLDEDSDDLEVEQVDPT